MEDLMLAGNAVTLVLLGALLFMVGLPGILLGIWKMTRLPFRAESLRWAYLGWALLLAASSVWNINRDVRYSAEEAGADNFVRLGFLALAILVILFIGTKHKFTFVSELTFGALGIFFLFSMWGLASALWSVSAAVTLYKSLEYGAMLILFALTVALIRHGVKDLRNRLLALKGIFDWNWLLIFLLLVSVYLGLVIWPSVGVSTNKSVFGFSIQGALPAISSNGVGQLAAVLGIVALARLLLKPRARFFYGLLFGFSMVTMVLAQSRSPILAFLLAAVVVLIASRRFGLLLFSSVSLGTVMVSAYSQVIVDYLRRGQSEQELATLTGRTKFWETSLQALYEQPAIGYGAYAGGRYVVDGASTDDGPTTVHSLFVEVLVDTGVVGFLLLLAGMVVTWLWMLRLRSFAAKDPISALLWLEGLGVLAVLSVRSIFSVPLVWSSNVLIFGVLLVFVSVMGRQVRRNVVYRRYPGAATAQPLPAAWRRGSGIRR